MSYLLFMDESGHDHNSMPYEVRGGVALPVGNIWPFVRALQKLELDCFGARLALYKKELKGSTLLDKKRFKFAHQDTQMPDEERRKHARGFLTKGLEKKSPVRDEFTAYGQACLLFAEGVFQLLEENKAQLIAGAIPRGAHRGQNSINEEILRKDHVFLFERFFYLLEQEQKHGIIVMDEVEKSADQKFVRMMEAYFTKTKTGRYRSTKVVPVPLFVASDMSYAVQAADLCIYAINWGFRVPSYGMDAETRDEVADLAGHWLNRLQFKGQGYRDGIVYNTFGIFFVPDLYESRK
jgi:hypothetical protein